MTTSEERYQKLYEEMAQLCDQEGWGDPFSYARSKEIYAATVLGHRVADTFSGADAFNEKGQPVEYKSTIDSKPKGSYTGISVQPTWAEQEKYLEEEKIAKYPEHYYNRFSNGKLVESWKMDGRKVLQILKPKLRKKFDTVLQKKDHRLSANVTWTEIKKYGKKVF